MNDGQMKRKLALAAGLACLLAASPAAAVQAARCRVTGVTEGVSLRLDCIGGERQVLLAAVRAPRPGPPQRGGEPYSAESRELSGRWLTGREVEEAGGMVTVEGEDVRLGLLSTGLVLLTAPATPASSADALDPLRAAERVARSQGRGVWSYQAWRRHQASLREPVAVAPPPAPPVPEALGAVAARLSGKSWQERRAAFEEAKVELSRLPPVAASATAESPAPGTGAGTAAPSKTVRKRGGGRARAGTRPGG